jgi:hypothetical protein
MPVSPAMLVLQNDQGRPLISAQRRHRHVAVRHQAPTVQQLPAGAYLSFASAPRTNSANEPSYMKIQDQGIRDGDGY